MRLIPLIAFLLAAGTGVSQRLTASWSTDSCQIGEPVEFRIRLKQAPKKVVYNAYSGEIPCEMRMDSSALTFNGTLEILKAFKDSTYKKGNETWWEGRYVVIAWDTGVYVMPRLSVSLEDTVLTAGGFQELTVSFVKKKMPDELEEVTSQVPDDSFWWLRKYWWIGLFPLLGLIIVLIRRRNDVKIVRQLSLKQRTQIALEALRRQAYWKSGRITEHYIEFSFLLRSFLSARYELNLTERTSYETLLLLSKKNIPADTLQRIRNLLIESDMVKFAKETPEEHEILLSMVRMEELIVELSPLDLIE